MANKPTCIPCGKKNTNTTKTNVVKTAPTKVSSVKSIPLNNIIIKN